MTIFPRGNRVLVKRDAAEGVSKGGIILPDAVQDKQQRGTVLAVDPEYQAAADQAQATSLHVGDVVLFTRFSGEGFKPDQRRRFAAGEGRGHHRDPGLRGGRMNRPTCQSCPHWFDPHLYSSPQDENVRTCALNPPNWLAGRTFGMRVETGAYESCGQHPDFPDYRAHLAASKS